MYYRRTSLPQEPQENTIIKLIGKYVLEGDEEPDFTPQPVTDNAMNKALAEQ